jgi:putative membrane protein
MHRKKTVRQRLSRVIRDARLIGLAELLVIRRYPQMSAALALVVLIPSIYLFIYLSSIWDPTARAVALPVGLVNQDLGMVYQTNEINLGSQLVDELKKQKEFNFIQIVQADEVKQQVRAGKLAFALIIPSDFSANAVPGLEDGRGHLLIYTSAGNNYESSVLAAQFAKELGENVNRTLNERRWALVLNSSPGAQQGLLRLRQALEQVQAGAAELASGSAVAESSSNKLKQGALRLQDGVSQLTEGTSQLGSGVRAIQAGLPTVDEVRGLRLGAEALATGHQELGKGLQELRQGSEKLRKEVGAFKLEADRNPYTPTPITDALSQLFTGVNQLDDGLVRAQEGQEKLSQGASLLSTKMGALAFGVRDLRSNLRLMTSKLPDDEQLEKLRGGAAELHAGTEKMNEGLHRLKDGTQQLSSGVALILKELPTSANAIEGSAQGLAHSVKPVLEVDAPVANYGSGFAPNIIAIALWLGAGISVFLINIRVLPAFSRRFHPLAQALGKVCVPAGVVVLQSGLLLLVVRGVLGIAVSHLGLTGLMFVLASLTFMLIVYALARVMGDAGKALAMLLLALQVSASGGVMPVELSASLYSLISPWLPMTWVIKGIKACMFDAFEGDWQTPALITIAWAGVFVVMASQAKNWRFENHQRMKQAIDL